MKLSSRSAARDLLFALTLIFALSGTACHSRGINVSVQNNAKVPLRNVEVDYPGASFGTGNIPPNGSYWYRIKPTSDGQLMLSFDQENGATQKEKGPTLHRGEEGDLMLIVDQDQTGKWQMRVEQK